MSEGLVSIIVPIYKVEEYLNECVESIIKQTYENWELFLSDDGSPDNCPRMCDEWAKKDTRITVIHKANGGVSSARNAGLDACKGQYIMFIDGDDYIKPDAIEKLVGVMKRDGSDMCVGNYVNLLDEEIYMGTRNKGITDATTDRKQYLERFYSFVPFYAQVSYKLFDSKLFLNERFPLGRINEDAYIMLAIVNQCKIISIMQEPVGVYRQRAGSITSQSYDKRIKDDTAWLELHIDYYQAHGEEDLKIKAIHQYCYMIIEYWQELTKNQKREYYIIFKKRCRDLLKCGKVGLKTKIKYLIGCINIDLCVKLFRHGYAR